MKKIVFLPFALFLISCGPGPGQKLRLEGRVVSCRNNEFIDVALSTNPYVEVVRHFQLADSSAPDCLVFSEGGVWTFVFEETLENSQFWRLTNLERRRP